MFWLIKNSISIKNSSEILNYITDDIHAVIIDEVQFFDENVINENNKIEVKKLQPITYDPCNRDYIALGNKVGNAFSDGKKIRNCDEKG